MNRLVQEIVGEDLDRARRGHADQSRAVFTRAAPA
jgi:hypothetical protein